ncbi:hypothetical protein BC936DRAFT_143580 [Jimgerdemannia flammicorona]|uniref:Uncharacterized protein n=2 Tax=Jimgerdemannia flammicorona TaxID=994334 RepID=A0A433QHS1_9FUNG|nr:hypothetical protein BC936DRAFT_143580 [Jimgerdemannia flammicorona]RUS29357.1 hypothetical protein BC938DRAFT_480757 [Jimgerdemannia flammicorona]
MPRDLPPEILNIIFSYFHNKSDLFTLAQVSKSWADSVCSFYIYPSLRFATPAALQKCLNVFSQTATNRKLRAQQNWSRLVRRKLRPALGASRPGFEPTQNFYSCRNYGLFVREIDLTKLQGKGIVTDREIEQLTNNCPYLRSINLYNCHAVTDAAIEHLATKCSYLETVYLAGLTTLTGSFLTALRASCPKLHTLNINLCVAVFGPHIIESTELSHLATLKLDKVTLVDPDLIMIAQHCAHTLITLSLNHCRITDTTIDELACICPRLHHLSISDLGYVRRLNLARLPPLLRTLNISKNTLTDATLATIARDTHHTLQSIDLSNTSTPPAGIRAILDACPRIERLLITRTILTRDLCLSLLHLAPNLTTLSIRACMVPHPQALLDALSLAAGSRLKHLDLSLSPPPGEDLLRAVSAKGGKEKIETLMVANVDRMGVGGKEVLLELPALFPRLRVLGLARWKAVDDEVVVAAVEGLERLEELDLAECWEVSEECMQLPRVRGVIEWAGWARVKEEVW